MDFCIENSYPDDEVIMKRLGILLYIFVLMVFGLRCDAQSQFSAPLSRMEKSLFGVDYASQADEARIKRIEEVVYGAPSTSSSSSASSKSVTQRMDKLSKDLSAELIGQEIKPKKDSFADDEGGYKEEVAKADSNINYPVVDSLEKKVFNKDFKTTDINKRLANLEQNVFKKTYNDDLNARVDRLKSAVAPDKIVPDNDSDSYAYNDSPDNNSDDSYTTEDILSRNTGRNWLAQNPKNAFVPNYNAQNSVLDDYDGDSDIAIPLSALEKSMLRRSFPDDTVSNRLTRLEVKMFSSNFSDDDEKTRLDRVASAYQAKKHSNKYDGNKFAQHSATAMQVGAILLMILAAII